VQVSEQQAKASELARKVKAREEALAEAQGQADVAQADMAELRQQVQDAKAVAAKALKVAKKASEAAAREAAAAQRGAAPPPEGEHPQHRDADHDGMSAAELDEALAASNSEAEDEAAARIEALEAEVAALKV
jgi:hypothetical protein